jgi:hypothetical protein
MSDPFDLFIIHVADDAKVALELAVEFARLGYRAWCYELDSLPLGNYVENIRRGIETASVLLVLVTEGSLEKDGEVTREIHFGQAGDKPFIPLVVELSDSQFERRVPLTWRQAFGEAVRVSVDPARVAPAARRIADGLKARDVRPRESDPADTRLPALLALIGGLDRTGSPTSVDWRQKLTLRLRSITRSRRAAMVAGALLLVMAASVVLIRLPALVETLQRDPPSPPTAVTIWIMDAQLEGFWAPSPDVSPAHAEYRLLRRDMESDLLRIAAAQQIEMQIVNDDEIEKALVNAGCPDLTKKFQIPECSEKKAFDTLKIRAKVHPTFHASTDGKRDLTLRIGRGTGVLSLPHSESLQDANLTTLADWSAEQIAIFLKIPRERIAEALGRQRENNRLLENTLGTATASPRGGSSRLPSLVRDVLAAELPLVTPVADVGSVLERLRTALETQDAAVVAEVFAAMPSDQREALQRYFDNVDDLHVSFVAPEITVDGDTARAAFLREDQFRDKLSGERTRLAVRLVAVFVRVNGEWKVDSLAKPS